MGAIQYLTLAVLSISLANAAVQVEPATVTDKHGNIADVNSEITWADMPAGLEYEVVPEDYSYNGLKPLFNGMHGFVKTCFGKEDPFDLALGLIGGTTAFGMDAIMSLAKWGYGYAACVVIGLLFIIIFPIVGCCFCCCRTCCGNCGGKMVQKRDGSWKMWRACYVITLFVSCTFLGCGMICTYVVNERMSTMFTEVSDTIGENVRDFQKYANNTLSEVNYVALDGFGFTADVMLRDLDNIGPIVGGAVQESFNENAGVDDAFDALLALDPLLLSLITDLEAVNTAKTSIGTSTTALSTAMGNVATDIQTTFDNCAICGSGPDLSGLSAGSNFDPSSMPSFDSQLTDLEAVYAQNISNMVLEGKQQFDNISGIVEDKASSVVTTIRDMVGTFDGVIESALGGINDMLGMFDSITNLTDPFSNLNDMSVSGEMTLADIENYRWMGGVGLTCFVLLILILQLTGLILGCLSCCCTSEEKLPTERGGMGNCAGLLLMASVGFVFIFGALIMLLVWLTYLVGAPMEQLLCKNLRDPEYTIFKQLIDGGDPASGPYTTIMGDQTGYTMGQMLFQDNTIPLTLSGLLTDCSNEAPAWEALYIGKFFDIDTVLDYKSSIDVDTEINKLSVDLSSLTILDDATKTEITNMGDALDGIDFAGLQSSLEAETVTVDFSSITSELQTVVDNLGTSEPTSKQALIDHIAELNRIEANELADVATAQADMLASVNTLQATASSVPTTITNLIDSLENTQTELQTNGVNIIKTESLVFANRVLGIADQFVEFVNGTIRRDLGKCKPVYNFYQSILVNTICGSVMDSWNGVWFTLGWCLAFMVLGIILSTKLAKHVRKMDNLHPDDQPPSYELSESERGDSSYGPGKGKVHPV